MEYIKLSYLNYIMYNQFTKSKSIIYILGLGFTIAVCYAIHEKYYKENDDSKTNCSKTNCTDCKDCQTKL